MRENDQNVGEFVQSANVNNSGCPEEIRGRIRRRKVWEFHEAVQKFCKWFQEKEGKWNFADRITHDRWKRRNKSDNERGGTHARNFRVLELEKHSDDIRGVSLLLPSIDVWYPNWGNMLLVWDVEELFSNEFPHQNSTRFDSCCQYHDCGEVVRWQRWNKRTGNDHTYS